MKTLVAVDAARSASDLFFVLEHVLIYLGLLHRWRLDPKTCTYIMLDVYLYQNYFMNALLFAQAFFSLPPTPYILYFLSMLMTRLLLGVGWSPVPEVEYPPHMKFGAPEGT